ncbi:MAG: YncE family protein [Ginsengibacter sp.]
MIIVLFSALLFAIDSSAQQRTLLALSKTDHTLAIVDPVTFKVMARIPVGTDPHEVIASSDGKMAFVSIYGGGSLHEINVIDLVAQKPLINVDTRPFMGPHGLAFAKDKVWFTAEGSKCVASYNPVTNKTDWCIGTGQDRTHMIYVTPDAKRIYTTNVNAGTVSIIVDTLMSPPPMPSRMRRPAIPAGPDFPRQPSPQPRNEWRQTVVSVSKGSEGFDVSPDGKQLWTVSAKDGYVWIIDATTKKVSAKIDAKILGANRLSFTPDGKRVLISTLRNGNLYVFDVHTHKLLKRINIGHGAAGILMDPDGTRAFIGCTPDDYVAVVDLKTLEVTNKINVGGGPDGLAWAEKK